MEIPFTIHFRNLPISLEISTINGFQNSLSQSITFLLVPVTCFCLFYPSSSIFSSPRDFPWSFMGTIWSSGSRNLSVSTFLHSLPHGFFHGSLSFGQGLPLPEYRSILLNSHFALTPEGDRHLDTFRLWESLSCGCIPLICDMDDSARHLLPGFPYTRYFQLGKILVQTSLILYGRVLSCTLPMNMSLHGGLLILIPSNSVFASLLSDRCNPLVQ